MGEIECALMSQKAAEAVRGLLCQQMADAAFILRGVGRCVHLHDLSHPKPWKCSIRMQLLREMRILLFCSVVGLWRCSESFVIPSSAWLSPPHLLPSPSPFHALLGWCACSLKATGMIDNPPYRHNITTCLFLQLQTRICQLVFQW